MHWKFRLVLVLQSCTFVSLHFLCCTVLHLPAWLQMTSSLWLVVAVNFVKISTEVQNIWTQIYIQWFDNILIIDHCFVTCSIPKYYYYYCFYHRVSSEFQSQTNSAFMWSRANSENSVLHCRWVISSVVDHRLCSKMVVPVGHRWTCMGNAILYVKSLLL